MDTSGYGGSRLSKNAVVRTDDPLNSRLTLTLSGPVAEFASLIPKRVILRGTAGKPITGMVTIVPKAAYPFTITEATARYGDKIRFRFDELSVPQPQRYLLTIENVQPHPGRYADTIVLKTDSPIRPQILIPVYGDIAGDMPPGMPAK